MRMRRVALAFIGAILVCGMGGPAFADSALLSPVRRVGKLVSVVTAPTSAVVTYRELTAGGTATDPRTVEIIPESGIFTADALSVPMASLSSWLPGDVVLMDIFADPTKDIAIHITNYNVRYDGRSLQGTIVSANGSQVALAVGEQNYALTLTHGVVTVDGITGDASLLRSGDTASASVVDDLDGFPNTWNAQQIIVSERNGTQLFLMPTYFFDIETVSIDAGARVITAVLVPTKNNKLFFATLPAYAHIGSIGSQVRLHLASDAVLTGMDGSSMSIENITAGMVFGATARVDMHGYITAISLAGAEKRIDTTLGTGNQATVPSAIAPAPSAPVGRPRPTALGEMGEVLHGVQKKENQSCEREYGVLLDQLFSQARVTQTEVTQNNALLYVCYGVTRLTKSPHSGTTWSPAERLAIISDYLESSGRRVIEWDDVGRMELEQAPKHRVLAAEQKAAPTVVRYAKVILGHAPNLKKTKDLRVWNMLMYRLRPGVNDAKKDAAGLAAFKKLFKKSPATSLERAAVRALGYIQ